MSAPAGMPAGWRVARRVLAIRLDNLGDVLARTPALHALKLDLVLRVPEQARATIHAPLLVWGREQAQHATSTAAGARPVIVVNPGCSIPARTYPCPFDYACLRRVAPRMALEVARDLLGTCGLEKRQFQLPATPASLTAKATLALGLQLGGGR